MRSQLQDIQGQLQTFRTETEWKPLHIVPLNNSVNIGQNYGTDHGDIMLELKTVLAIRSITRKPSLK